MRRAILTVCTGNICRSPVAEAALRQRCPDLAIGSAGLHALAGRDIDPDSAHAARAFEIALAPHTARQFDEGMGREADMIIVMEAHHREEIMRRWPHLLAKTFLLGQFERGKEIPDPYKRGYAQHLRMAELVLESVEHWAVQLARLNS